jgi:hypothetical protein
METVWRNPPVISSQEARYDPGQTDPAMLIHALKQPVPISPPTLLAADWTLMAMMLLVVHYLIP